MRREHEEAKPLFEVSSEDRDEDKELEGRGWAVNYESGKKTGQIRHQ